MMQNSKGIKIYGGKNLPPTLSPNQPVPLSKETNVTTLFCIIQNAIFIHIQASTTIYISPTLLHN